MQLSSRLSVKGQITVPKEIRDLLALKPGDVIAYEVRNGTVILRRAEPFDTAFHDALSATLDEWVTSEDEEAFRDLWPRRIGRLSGKDQNNVAAAFHLYLFPSP